MVPKGRPPLSAEAIQEKVAAYCTRYGIDTLTPAGLPPFPAGKRETRQHREWIVLCKAVTRQKRRAAAAEAVRSTGSEG